MGKVNWNVWPQSRRVGRAVLCTPGRDYGRTAACRGLPALPPPAMTEALHWNPLARTAARQHRKRQSLGLRPARPRCLTVERAGERIERERWWPAPLVPWLALPAVEPQPAAEPPRGVALKARLLHPEYRIRPLPHSPPPGGRRRRWRRAWQRQELWNRPCPHPASARRARKRTPPRRSLPAPARSASTFSSAPSLLGGRAGGCRRGAAPGSVERAA